MLNFFQTGIYLSGSSRDRDTTADGRQAFLIIGDSIAGDTTAVLGAGPTTPAGTTYLWNGTNLVELTTADLNNAGSAYGTAWKKFALDYNAGTSRKPCFINRASGGSEFYPDGDNNNWYTSGVHYSAAVTAANACLSFMGVSKLKGIFICLGINDARGAQTTANIQSAIISLITRLNSDFQDTKIYITSIGRTESSFIGDRIFAIKGYIKDLTFSYSNVELVANLTTFVSWNLYSGDNLHPTQAGNDKHGELYARALLNTDSSSKIVRQVHNIFYNQLSSNNKLAVADFIEGCIIDGNWDDTTMDTFQFYHPTDVRDKVGDWCNMCAARLNGTADGDGTNFVRSIGTVGNYISTNFAPSFARKASQSDFITADRTGTVTTAAGTAGHLHSEGATNRLFQGVSSVLSYNCNDGTVTSWSGGDPKFSDNTEYARARNGTTKSLIKNGTQVNSATVASSAPSTNVILLGQADGSTAYLHAQHKYFYYAKRTTFNHTSFISRLNTLISSWT